MGTRICTFGSCVTRDVFHYTFPERYEIAAHIGWIPVSTLDSDAISITDQAFPYQAGKFYIRMMQAQFQNDAVERILSSHADYLVMDCTEERLDQYELSYQSKTIRLADFWANTAINGAKDGFWIEQVYKRFSASNGVLSGATLKKLPALSIPLSELETAYRSFFQKILKSDTNPNGLEERQIILFETYLAKNILNESGKLQAFSPKWQVDQKNAYLKQIYEIVRKIVPNCYVIKLPNFTFGNWHHIWGTNPLHYNDQTYQYFATALDIVTKYNPYRSTPEKLWKQQSLENQLAQRVANATPLYDVIPMKRRLEQAEAQIHALNEVIQKQQETIDALQLQINQWNTFQSDKE